MSDTFELITTYGVKYTNHGPVPIDDIVASLKGYEALLKRTPAFLEKHYKGIKVTKIEVFVENIESGSLSENFLVKLIFKTDDNIATATALAEKVLQENDVVHTIVALGVGAVIGFGLYSLRSKNTPSTNITAYNNTIVNIGGTVDLTADDIQAVLSNIKDKKQLAKESVAVIKPSKSDANSTIEIEGMESLNIQKGVIAEAPDTYEPETPAERTVKYSNAHIVVFASDQDNNDKGWAGIVPTIIDKRVKFTIAETVNPKNLHGRKNLMADIEVTEYFVASKKAYEAKSVEILKTN